MTRALPFFLVLAACNQQPAAAPVAQASAEGTIQTPLGTAVDRPAATRQDILTPGQWELAQVTRSITGGNVTPEMRTALVGKTVAYDACIPAEEAAAPDANFFAGGSTNECKYTSHEWKNGKLSATIACNATPGAITMTMNGTYDPTTMVAEATMTTRGAEGGDITQNVQLKGRRLGVCRASQNTPR